LSKAEDAQSWTFTRGAVADRSCLYVGAVHDTLIDDELSGSVVFRVSDDLQFFDMPFRAAHLAYLGTSDPLLLCSSNEGECRIALPGRFADEIIADGDQSPARRGVLRELRVVADGVWAVGMDRQVYRRRATNTWERVENGLSPAQSLFDVTGLNSIDGLPSGKLVSVGWGGEIWWWDGHSWHQDPVPTNLKLEKVAVNAPDDVIIGGQRGLVLRGRRGHWRVVDNPIFDADVTAIAVAMGTVWLATLFGLYRFDEGGDIVAVDVSIIDPSGQSFGWLTACPERIWSIGRKRLLYSDDGIVWSDRSLA
jgi:hypothetical protein